MPVENLGEKGISAKNVTDLTKYLEPLSPPQGKSVVKYRLKTESYEVQASILSWRILPHDQSDMFYNYHKS